MRVPMTDPAPVAAIDREIAATMDFDHLIVLMSKRYDLTGQTRPNDASPSTTRSRPVP